MNDRRINSARETECGLAFVIGILWGGLIMYMLIGASS